MSKRSPKPLILDMLHCIDRVDEYTRGQSFEDFLINGMVRDAVARNIQIIGEAAIRMPSEFKAAHPEIEWIKIIRSRHILTHEYDGVDERVIWRIITIYLPALRNDLQKILKSL